MTPWFVRNLNEIDALLPSSGFQAAWLTEYNDLFNYPAQLTPSDLFADGVGLFATSRWRAFLNNVGTFVAVEGLIVLAPLMTLGWWRRRQDAFLAPFTLFVAGIHAAMTLVFPFPGVRGGLFHAVAALVPFWSVLGVIGLDAAVDAIAQRRRNWNARDASRVFSAALVVLAVFLSIRSLDGRPASNETPESLQRLTTVLPDDARVMINDPAQLYYFTGLSGVALPNESPIRSLRSPRGSR